MKKIHSKVENLKNKKTMKDDVDTRIEEILNRKRTAFEPGDEPKKPIVLNQTKKYTLEDIIDLDTVVGTDIHVRLLRNRYGHFVDLRRYVKKAPTKYGIRMSVKNFKKVIRELEGELDLISDN